MRTREKSFEDYGMTKDEVEYVKKFCINSTAEQRQMIKNALSEISPYIAEKCLESLVENKSFDDLCKEEYVYICKDDFYAYRRKGIEAIKRWMIWNNIWEM